MRRYAILLAGAFFLRSTGACFSADPKELAVLHHSDSVVSIAFTPDGKTLVTSDNHAIRLWDVASAKERSVLTKDSSVGKAVAVSPDGKWLASGDWDGMVRLWDRASGAKAATLAGHTGPLLTVAFSPDGSLLASGGRVARAATAEVKLWDMRTRTEIASLPGVADPVGRLAFSPDGTTVAVGDVKGRVFLWDVASKRVRRTFSGQASVSRVVWSPDGRRLISGGNDVRIWQAATGELLATLPVGDKTDDCFGLAITTDGTLLASGTHRGNIRIWQVATREAKLTLKQAPPNEKPMWKPIQEMKEPETNVYCVAFSPDDTLLAAGVGPTVKIWDVKALLSANTGAAEKQSK
jgi:WD40 repeat protein